MQQSDMTFEEMNRFIRNYMEERDWHNANARNLAVSIVLESGELLEHYQWSDKSVGDKQALAEELADVFVYAFQFAQVLDIDITEAIKSKLAKSAQKYPAHEFKGKTGDDKRTAWQQAKLRHQKDGL